MKKNSILTRIDDVAKSQRSRLKPPLFPNSNPLASKRKET
ncbi:hypothetical protein OROGR_033038 [Orobanche gracilis]